MRFVMHSIETYITRPVAALFHGDAIEMPAPSEEDLAVLLRISAEHDVSHLTALILKQAGFLEKGSEIRKKFETEVDKAVFRYERQAAEFTRICACLEEAKIPFIPLKGTVLRQWYPEPWMRTSSDIDLLVPEDALEQAKRALMGALSYEEREQTTHDLSLYSSTGVHLELHHTLVEEGRANQAAAVLDRVWGFAAPLEAGRSEYALSDAAFYFYHIAHMAKHFEESGIGLRFFLDLWILDHFVECDAAAREALLMEGGLLPFSQAMRKASEAWFSGEAADEATVRIQKYVVASGIYGSKHHRVAIERAKNGTSGKQVKRRIFMPYQELKKQYPVLEEHPVLTPAYEVRRWAHLLKRGRLQSAADELKEIRDLKESDVQAVEQLMTDAGLNGPVSS